jgi:uncharacterized protein (DUF433 family)
MTLVLDAPPTETVPLKTDSRGAIRVGGTRVTLDVVIAAYQRGATAEDIVRQFDVLRADDVHAVLAYYLRHRGDVDAYLTERAASAADLRAEMEHHFPPDALRDRLRAQGEYHR